jgi:Zn-finger nucleic acid-binding protein
VRPNHNTKAAHLDFGSDLLAYANPCTLWTARTCRRRNGERLMVCPDCHNGLTNTFYEGVRIAVCTRCAGAFLDDADLKTIIERKEVEISREEGVSARPREPRVRSCPKCESAMSQAVYKEVVQVDRCAQCRGLWLDPHELEDIQFLAEQGDS